MIVLGINQDRYDSGATLVDGNRILFAANEERYTRRKTQGGLPLQTINAAFDLSGVEMQDVDAICVAGLMTPPLPVRVFPKLHQVFFEGHAKAGQQPGLTARLVDFVQNNTPLAHTSRKSILRRFSQWLLPFAVRRTLPKPLRGKPIHFVEHHLAHAASAWHLSDMDDALCITADGMGDGLSMTVSRCSANGIERLWSASSRDSLGQLFEMVTESLGFIPCRHEGKVMGLAAHGDPSKVAEADPFTLDAGGLRYNGPAGIRGVRWLKSFSSNYSREDIAAWVQQILERHAASIAERWLAETGLNRLVVAGGIFANVKLNQRLSELTSVNDLFVCPNMGDGGLSLGAICNTFDIKPVPLNDVFLGDKINSGEIELVLKTHQLHYEKCDDIERRTAELLAEGKIVARCRGRMEWGPRALGNRSVLASTNQPDVAERLNRLLQRSDFMPFAPAVLDETADKYFTGLAKARHAAQFMTVCFNATDHMQNMHPAVTHVDATVRPQLVTRQHNPTFHHLLTEYEKLSKSGIVLNTSFNIHEEPIVRTAMQAVNSFLQAGLDYLALESYLIASPAGSGDETQPQ